MAAQVIVAGHLCLDLLPDMQDLSPLALTTPGRLYEVGAIQMATGGAVSNTGLALDRLGVKVSLMTKLGDDLIAELIRSVIRRVNPTLDETIRVVAGGSSSYTIVLSPAGQDRIFLHYPGTNDRFNADWIDYQAVEGAQIFHLGYPPLLPQLLHENGAGLCAIYERVKRTGVVTSLDMVYPDPNRYSGQVDWRTILSRALPNVDVFLPSLDEIMFMLRRADYERWGGSTIPHITRHYLRGLADDLLAMGVAIAGFKLGEKGVYVRASTERARLERLGRLPIAIDQWAGAEAYHPAFEVKVAGTTGAGDCCYAAFLAALLKGLTPDQAVRMANAVGACNVEAPDSLSGVRTWDETAARIAAGWAVKPDTLPD